MLQLWAKRRERENVRHTSFLGYLLYVLIREPQEEEETSRDDNEETT